MLQTGDFRGWWLLALAGLVLAALLLRSRRRRVVSAVFFLVRRLAAGLSAESRGLRLRRLAARALFVASVLGIALAGFDPYYTSGDAPVRELAIVDLSPSLGVVEGSRPRARRLQAELERYTGLLQPQDRVVFVLAAPQPASTPPLDGPAARAWVAGLDHHSASADLPGALRIAAALAGASRFDHILLFTDRLARWQEATDGLFAALSPAVVSFGEAVPNAGIEAFDLRPSPATPSLYDMYVRFGCYGPTAAASRGSFTLALLNNGRRVRDERRECRTGVAEEFLLEQVALESGEALLQLEPADAYPEDNRVFAGISATPPIKVVLVSPGDAFLLAALESDPGVDLTVQAPGAGLPRDQRAIYVFDGPVPPGELPERALFIQPDRTLETLAADSFLSYPERISWEPEEPVLQGVDLEGLTIQGMTAYPQGTDFRPIAWADGRPLILLRAQGGRRWAVLAFHPSDTNLVYTPGYPVLAANILRWLALFSAGERPFHRVGEPVHLPLSATGGKIRTPAGTIVSPPAAGSRPIAFTGGRHPGRYEVSSTDGRALGAFYVNALDPAATAEIAAPGFGQGGGAGLPPGLARGPLRVALAPWLALAALCLLAAEALFAAAPASRRE